MGTVKAISYANALRMKPVHSKVIHLFGRACEDRWEWELGRVGGGGVAELHSWLASGSLLIYFRGVRKKICAVLVFLLSEGKEAVGERREW